MQQFTFFPLLPSAVCITSANAWLQKLVLSTAVMLLASTAANGSVATSLVEVDEHYQRVTTAAFQDLVTQQTGSAFELSNKSIKQLAARVRNASKNKEQSRAIAYIAANTDIVSGNFDAKEVPTLIQTLLNNHAIALAESLLALARREASSYSLARIRLVFVQHYAAQAKWQKALDELANIDIANVLDTEEGDEAYISYGVALQGQKKHREAAKYYARVKPESAHYRVAQLNTALAYIRQDWWTDAQLAIKSALKSGPPPKKDELTNRIHTVLGFSQIQYGFYRDARESFRNVQIDSYYANRALLGLGVAALHQEDMIGALNAFNHLKSKDADDISVLESYLLSAYALDKLGQNKTASAGYTEAIAYYGQYQSRCDNLIDKIGMIQYKHAEHNDLFEQALVMASAKRRASLRALTDKITIVSDLLEHQPARETKARLTSLRQTLNSALAEQTIEAVTERKSVIDSYLSQSRFGLAQLYDAR